MPSIHSRHDRSDNIINPRQQRAAAQEAHASADLELVTVTSTGSTASRYKVARVTPPHVASDSTWDDLASQTSSPAVDEGFIDTAEGGEATGTGSMSRAPLLVRSSPALGTASYGGIPYSPDTSADNSDDEDTTPTSGHKSSRRFAPVKRGRSALHQAVLVSDNEDEQAESSRSQSGNGMNKPNTNGSRRRKRHHEGESASRSRKSRSSTLQAATEGSEATLGPDLQSRFSSDGIVNVPDIDSATDDAELSLSGSASDSDTSDADLLTKRNTRRTTSEDSPYPQVRASVPPTDNISLSINTPRMWTLSMLFAVFGSSTNLFFSLRYPSVAITPVIALLLTHPLGLIWDRILKRREDPDEIFLNGALVKVTPTKYGPGARDEITTTDGRRITDRASSVSWKRRVRLYLAQGRWNEKEHCCVFIASNVSFGFAFATDVIVEQTKFYHQDASILYQILLTLSTQILGYAFAGLTRRFLVRPAGMIWPGTLVSTAMFSSLHREENKPANGWCISRWRFFLIVFCGSVAFYFLPGFLMPALSYFNVITWFAPRNVVVANLFGVASGLGLFPMTFDWSQIAYIGSPLVVPFWAALNIVGGLVIVMWIIAPILYYSNVLFSSYMPILSTAVFDNKGRPYDVSKILTDDFLFDNEAYQRYSRVYLPITYVLSYALQFAAMSALLTHTLCWHGKDIWRQWKASLAEIKNEPAPYCPIPEGNGSTNSLQHRDSGISRASMDSQPILDNLIGAEDIHARLMRRYDDVPLTWYLLTGIVMTAVGIFVVEVYPVHLPWYGLLLSLGICTVLFIPIGIVQAITNQHSSIYLICQLICGVVFPGRPVANMVFVTYGYISSAQGLKFTSDLKLGHYMKIPPRILFSLQLAATAVASFTQIASLNWMLVAIPNICTPQAINGFTCPIARVHFNGSILWGVVGPQRFFGKGALYRPLVWAFLIGAVAPIIVWILGRRGGRRSVWRKVNLPVLFGSISWIPPATGLNFSVWAVVCWIFNDVLRRRKREWWKKYTMTLSAALDSGLAVGVVIVFFGLLYPGWEWVSHLKWWGTEVYKEGCDWQACAYRTLKDDETFGPPKW